MTLSLRSAFLAAGLALSMAACAGLPPEPQVAHLSRDHLAVTLSDGSRCVGSRPADAGPGGWSGQMTACPVPLSYTVSLDPRTNPLRHVAEALFTALTLEDTLPPMADVTLQDASGRTFAFRSPPPVED